MKTFKQKQITTLKQKIKIAESNQVSLKREKIALKLAFKHILNQTSRSTILKSIDSLYLKIRDNKHTLSDLYSTRNHLSGKENFHGGNIINIHDRLDYFESKIKNNQEDFETQLFKFEGGE